MSYYKMIYCVNGLTRMETSYSKGELLELLSRLENNGYYIDTYKIVKVVRK